LFKIIFYRCKRFNTNQSKEQVRSQEKGTRRKPKAALVWRAGLSGVPRGFIPWFGQVQHLPTPRCGVPMDESCTQLLSSDPMINLNTMVFFFSLLFPVCEESPQLGVSRPYNENQSESTRVREGSNTHKSTTNTHTHGQNSSSNEYHKVLTRKELESLRMSNKCAKTKCE
jgi:hypothetical protein